MPPAHRRRATVALPLILVLAGCAGGPNPPGGPLDWGARTLGIGPRDGGSGARRGAVEVIVKSGHPAILAEIEAGGGPVLASAMDAARVPPQDRPARLLQLRADIGLYEVNPGALVAALMLYGG